MQRDDLCERTERFARDVRSWVRRLPRTESNREDVKQLARASGSVAANQIEADDALGERDQLMKFRTCRKEARESGLWLRLIDTGGDGILDAERARLDDESRQITRIYSTIIRRLGGG